MNTKKEDNYIPLSVMKKRMPGDTTFMQSPQNGPNPFKKQKLEKYGNSVYSPNSKSYMTPLMRERRKLPVFNVRSRLLQEIQRCSTLIVIGETGSGKTTQIPQFINEENLNSEGIIGVTQPRRVACTTLAKRVAQEMNVALGKAVGYTIRFEDTTCSETRLKFVTDGMLFREAMLDKLLLKYSFIILDEAHERSVNTDVLFGIVKIAQNIRASKGQKPLKLVIMSATMDVDHFSKYFNNAPVIYLEGRQHPVQIFNAKDSQSDYVLSCLSTIFRLHKEEPPGKDILVFLTGQEEIEAAAHAVRQAAKGLSPTLRVFPLYSALPLQKLDSVFRPSAVNERKVIISTNVAETSLTIPGVTFVIDSCRVKARVFQPNSGLDLLKVQKVCKDQAWQRAGRAGRESAGVCYRVLTNQEFNNLPKSSTPEILRCNLSSILLQLLQLGIDAYTFDFMDKPSKEALDAAVALLKSLGAIESVESRKLTSLGVKMAQFPLDPRLSKILISSKNFNCTEEVLSIVSVLCGDSVLCVPNDRRERAAEEHKKFISSEGDHITLLNIYKQFKSAANPNMYCYDNFLNQRNLQFASRVRQQLAEICLKCDIPLRSCGQNNSDIRKCLAAGYFMNVAELQADKKYLAVDTRQAVRIHPSSVLHKTLPYYVIFSEIVQTSQTYIRQLSIVDPELLDDIAPEYFRLHRLGFLSEKMSD